MKTITAKEMQELDRRAIEEYGIPSLVLMENAGAGVARHILQKMPKSVLVLCGKGNNGGDGLVVARLLHEADPDMKVEALLLCQPEELKTDPRVNYDRLQAMNLPCRAVAPDQVLFNDYELCVDALFGIGLSRALRDPYPSLINSLNASQVPVIAIDIPSGLHADTGECLPVAIKAESTITLGMAKHGLVRGQGPSHCGQVIVQDIGIPKELFPEAG